jgi:hypothetical protein
MVQAPLVNIGDLVWVKIRLGKDHYTSLTAFVLSVNHINVGIVGEYISSYHVEYFEINTTEGTTLYGVDYGNRWGKLDT